MNAKLWRRTRVRHHPSGTFDGDHFGYLPAGDQFMVWSTGMDGESETEDDIVWRSQASNRALPLLSDSPHQLDELFGIRQFQSSGLGGLTDPALDWCAAPLARICRRCLADGCRPRPP